MNDGELIIDESNNINPLPPLTKELTQPQYEYESIKLRNVQWCHDPLPGTSTNTPVQGKSKKATESETQQTKDLKERFKNMTVLSDQQSLNFQMQEEMPYSPISYGTFCFKSLRFFGKK